MIMLQEEIIPGNTASNSPRVSLAGVSTELIIANLSLNRRVNAQEAAANICGQLDLKTTVRLAKWLTQHRNRKGYQNKPTSLRMAVQTESLSELDSSFPISISDSKAKLLIYRRSDDKAYYVDETGYTIANSRPSLSPEPVKG